ncbi:hypothetical protein ACQPW1_48270 [Nocardia sp. CA-128927]|uniref:hypothetical protein n=1 Tax=Nocardia sp. CA-128927 TaxID=3239975 RepID=UPI003D95E631
MKATYLAVYAATALAVIAGSTGCGKDDTDHSEHAAHGSSTSAGAAAVHTADATKQADSTHNHPAPTDKVDDVNCGPVTDAGGGTRTVIAVSTVSGRVGCTEAINVATKYATTVSNTDVQTVDGWQCNAQPDPATPSVCAKGGLIIGLRAS